jgi:hypothetical protein
MSHFRGGDEDPCVCLLFHMLRDIHMFGGMYCRVHKFGGKVAHVVDIFLLVHLSTYFHACLSIRRRLWGVFIVFKAKVTYLKAFLTTWVNLTSLEAFLHMLRHH